MKKNLIFFLAWLFLLNSTQKVFAQTNNDFSVTAFDTVANFETKLQGMGLLPEEKVIFRVKKPDDAFVLFTAEANKEGKAEISISDLHTRLAGIYRITLERAIGISKKTQFRVFPGETSANASALFTSKEFIAANGVESATISVRVVDDFGNPLPYHEVSLRSNRTADRISEVASETNEHGIAYFIISSNKVGVSHLTATDESSQTFLSKSLKMVFFRSENFLQTSAIGGDPFDSASLDLAPLDPAPLDPARGRLGRLGRLKLDKPVLLAQASQTVSRFLIDNLPATVTVNETMSFRVSATDVSGNVVPSYIGTIAFSSTDPNGQLPQPYTFQAANQGKKTFDLGLTFRTVGSQKLTVQAQGNALLKGEKTIEVVSTPIGRGSAAVRLTRPATGTYSVNRFEIAGEASPSARVKIFDLGQQIAEVQTDTSGRFSYTTSLLPDGTHTFHAESNGVQSTPVTVTIDSTPARVEQVDISHRQLAPSATTPITIRSDPDLTSIQATIGEFITDLEPDPQNPGVYRGNLTAPAKEGEYTVNVVITDKIGNVSPATEVGKLRVDSTLREPTPASLSVPSKVQSVRAIAGNGRVTVSWQPAQALSGIAFYRIYYGTDGKTPNIVVNTKDNQTNWTIPNLKNGTAYFFQIVGVDQQGSESDQRSEVVSMIPQDTKSPVLCDPMPCPPDITPPPITPEDGPGVLGMVVAAMIGGWLVKGFRKK